MDKQIVNSMMNKKAYMKPTMHVMEIQQQRIICSSPTSVPVHNDAITDERYVW